MPINWDEFLKAEPQPSSSKGINWDSFVTPEATNKPGILSDVKRGTGQIVEAAGSALRDLGAEDTGSAIENYGSDVVRRNPSQINSLSDVVDKPFTTAREAIGEVVPQVGGNMAGGLAGRMVGGAIGGLVGSAIPVVGTAAGAAIGQNLGAAAGAYGFNLMQEYGGIRKEQRDAGIEDKTRALGTAGGAALLDTAFGTERVAGKFIKEGLDTLARKEGADLLKHVGKQAAIGVATESPTEIAQTALERFGAHKALTGDEAVNEYGLAGIKGGLGGGMIRGGMSVFAGTQKDETAPGNDIKQAFTQPDTNSDPITTTDIASSEAAAIPPVAPPDPNAGVGKTVSTPGGDYQITGRDEDGRPIWEKVGGQTPAVNPTAPAVAGGTTDIAQAQQAAQQQTQAADAALQEQARREKAFETVGATEATGPAGPGITVFGQTVFGPQVATFGNALAGKINALPEHGQAVVKAIAEAHVETGNKLVSFQYNGSNPVGSADKLVKALSKVADKFQIGHANTTEQAAAILNEQSKTAKGDKLEQINAMHVALTGNDTTGFLEAFTPTTKGASDGKLQVQQQDPAGVRAVREQSGAAKTPASNAGDVQPGGVQPIGSGSQPEGSLGLQVGQPAGGGVRDGSSGVSNAGSGDAAPTQVTPTQELVNEQGQSTPAQTEQGKVQPAGETPAGPGVQEPSSADQAVPAAAEVTDADRLADQMESITDEVMRLLVKPTSRMDEGMAQTQREFVFTVMSNGQYASLAVMAEDFGIKLHQAKDWSAKAKALRDSPEQIAAAYEAVAESRGLTVSELLARIEAKSAAVDQQLGTVVDESISTSREEGGPTDSDERKLNTQFDAEGKDEVGDREITDEGLAVKGRKSGESLQERYNAVDTNQAKYLRLVNLLEEAEDAGDEAAVARIKAQLEVVLTKGVEQGNKRTKKSAVATSPEVVKREPDTAAMTAAAARWKEVGGDLTKLTDAELEAIKARAEKFNNKKLTADVTAELSKRGGTDAVQEQSTGEVDVRQPAGNGETVGEGNAKSEKPAGEGEKPKRTRKKAEPKQEPTSEVAVRTPQEQYEALTEGYPVPAWSDLTEKQRDGVSDLAHRDQLNLAALNTLLSSKPKQITNNDVIDVESRVVEETVGKQVLALPEPQVSRLERHYGLKSGTAEFLEKVKEDVVKYATKGAEAVAAAIRDVIAAVAKGVLAAAVVFNPVGLSEKFSFDLPEAYAATIDELVEIRDEVPANAVAKMSADARHVYESMAPTAKKSGKGFMIADKQAGMLHVFNADGSLFAQEPALFGKDVGDKLGEKGSLVGGPRVTPAGQYTMQYTADSEYEGGHLLRLVETMSSDGVIAVHAAWLGDPSEKRSERLASKSSADNRISYGCINTSHDLFLNKIIPAADKFNGGMIFVLPEQSSAKDMFKPQVKLASSGERPTSFKSRNKTNAFYDFGDLADEEPTAATGADWLASLGIEHVLDYVSDWETFTDTSEGAIGGEILAKAGRYTVRLNTTHLQDPDVAAENITHEVGHAVDMAPHGGIYSSQPEMSVLVSDGKVVPVGKVARELYALYESNEHWREYFEYPFDLSVFSDITSSVEVEGEIFAQLFSLYTNPRGRAALERRAPLAAAFMAEVIRHVRSTKSLQLQTERTAAQRTVAFRNRNPSQGSQVDEQASGRARKTNWANRRPAEVIAALPEPLRAPTQSVLTNVWADVKKAGLALAMTEDVIKLASKTMKSANDYLQAQFDQMATRLTFENQVQAMVQRFNKLPKELQGTGDNSVNKLIYDMTMDGKWGFAPSYNPGMKVDPAMKARFDALEKASPEAAKLVRDVLEHGYKALKLKQQAVKAAADKVFATREADAQGDQQELAEIALERKAFQAKFDRILKIKADKPYAYLGRYGNYVAVAKSAEYADAVRLSKNGDLAATKWLKDNEANPDHYVVAFAETQGEADQLAAAMKAQGGYASVDSYEKKAGDAYVGGGDLFLAFKRLENMVTRKAKDGTEKSEVLDGVRKLMTDLYLTTLAEASAHLPTMARKGIAGADKDMIRNLATRGRADAHFLAALQHGNDVTDAMDRMIDEADENRREATPYLNELLKRQGQSMQYKLPGTIAQAAAGLSTAYYLTFSPSFYLQQSLQTAVLTWPYLAGRMGSFRSARAIRQAYTDILPLVKGTSVTEHLDFSKAPADVQSMLQTLVGMGKIDIGIDYDSKTSASAHGPMAEVMRKLQGVNTRIETINRAVAATAAYRAYLQKYGADKTAAATQYAADVVSNTHGSYDGFNTPRALSSDVGRVVGQFKRFQIIQISMLAKLLHNAFKASSPEEKAVARRTIGFITGHMAVLGGALGVPFVSQLGQALLSVFGDKDEPDDLEQYLRKAIDDKAVADLLLRGVPSAIGLESLGKKLSMENTFSLLPYTDLNLSDRDALTKVYVSMLGPSAALSLKMADGLGMMRKGDLYKGMEMLLPNGVANVMKGARYLTDGVTMRNGDTVMGPEEVSILDAAFQAVGLPTNTITDRQRVQKVVAETDQFYEDHAAQIKNDYVKAFRKGDSSAMQDAREAWQEMQDARARNGYQRQPLSTLFKAPMAAVKRERNVAGGVEYSKSNRRFVERVANQ